MHHLARGVAAVCALVLLITPTLAAAETAEPLASFKAVVQRYETFFAEPHILIDRQIAPWAPDGAYFVSRYQGAGASAYDVQTTTSLVSPYIAHLDVPLQRRDGSALCGEYQPRGLRGYWGWRTADAAMDSLTRPECSPWDLVRPISVTVRFGFAYQEGKWVLKTVRTLPNLGTEASLETTITQLPVEGRTLPIAGEPPTLNKPWLALAGDR